VTYQITLPQFKGPLDLLLFFIERDELNIHDIPIAKLANDFLEYIKQMRLLNIDLASEFMVVAATLMRIKAKMLLPRPQLNEAGEQIDPREELVQRLLAYKQFKAVTNDLQAMERIQQQRFARGHASTELSTIAQQFSTEALVEQLSLYKLMQTFQNVIERLEDRKKRVRYSVLKHPYTIKNQKQNIHQKLQSTIKLNFQQTFEDCYNRVHAIFRFLAILEMVHEKYLHITLGDVENSFWLAKGEVFDTLNHN